jgi:Ala-tRNA(Pro) deacylase
MAITERVNRLLDAEGVHYETLPHGAAFTAQEVAEASHVSGRRVAKVLIAKEHDGRYLMVVLPAPCRVDLIALRDAAGTRRLSLASEGELVGLFPDCDMGATPPFGNLYNMPVYVDACFPRAGDFFFQAGNHHEIVRIPYEDFERLVHPVVGEFCLHEREKIVTV